MSSRQAVLTAIFFTLLSIALLYYWPWYSNAANGGAVNAISLIVGLIGFPLTLLQLWRTKRAANAAKDAAEDAKLRFDAFNALRECDRARSECTAISRSINSEDWQDVLVRYNGLADRLTEILHSNPKFGGDFSGEMQTAVDRIEAISGVIERENRSARNRLEKSKQLSDLRKIYGILRKSIVWLEGQSS